ncbi:MAG: GMC family oxidoreductase [Candidatus Thiodiazotropha sp.]
MMDYDVIVIGSGFGGAVAACRLAERGQKVLVLERGRRWQVEDYPRDPDDSWLWDERYPEHFNGWTDVQFFDDMAVARGAGVGGGSLMYASVSIVPPRERFEQGWPEAISYEEMLPYYERVGQMLKVQILPQNQLTRRYHLMQDAADNSGIGDRFRRVELAVNFDPEWHYGLDDPFNDNKSKSWVNEQGQQQGTCVHCGNCDAGCQIKAKNTLDLNYIPQAEKHGAEVRPLHIARKITSLEKGYRVDFEQLQDGNRIPGSASATRVVLAAGSLGTVELLLRCRDQYKTLPGISDRLGYGWSPNGDFVTPSVHEREVSASQGPTISSAIDLLDGHYQGAKLFVEDGGFPDLLGNFLEQHLKRRRRPLKSRFGLLFNTLARRVRARDPMDNLMLWFGQAVEAADGRFYLGRPWYAPWRKQLMLDWDIRRSEATMQAMADLHTELSHATGGTPFIPPTWSILKNLITPHPLGGCAMADSPDRGVVNDRGEVFGYPGLYVADSALFPQALGLNPSRTIAALAERIADKMVL